jgi:hypothetical protein
MIIEIALGIVLAVILLTFISVALADPIGSIRWISQVLLFLLSLLFLGASILGIGYLLYSYPSEGIRTLIILALIAALGYFAIKFYDSDHPLILRFGRMLTPCMKIVDQEPPFDRWFWFPIRFVAVFILVGVLAYIFAGFVYVMALVWQILPI